MRIPFLAALAALTLTVATSAQDQKLGGMAVSSERGETRLMVANKDFSVFSLASLTYGRPDWSPKHAGDVDKMDAFKGKTIRLGKDGFTTLITFSELEIGGAKIGPGSYIVALQLDNDGKPSLAFLDSTKAMKEKVFPGMDFKADVLAPVTFNKGASKDVVAKMTMTFDAKKEDGGKGTLTIAWGPHTVTAPCQLHAPK
jgi:hypothetical protein